MRARPVLLAVLAVAALSGCIQINIGTPEAPTPQSAQAQQAPDDAETQAPRLSVDFYSTPDVTAEASKPVRFQATVDGRGERTIDVWHWEFGDNKTAEGPSATHTYAKAGDYKVELRVIASDGSIVSKQRTLIVVNPRSA